MDSDTATPYQTSQRALRSEFCRNASKYECVTMLQGSITGCET